MRTQKTWMGAYTQSYPDEEEVETEKRQRVGSVPHSRPTPPYHVEAEEEAKRQDDTGPLVRLGGLSPRNNEPVFPRPMVVASLRARIQDLIALSYTYWTPANLCPVFEPYSGHMQGFDLSDLNFTLARMQGIDFTGVTFRGSNFLHSRLTGCILRRADFSRALLAHTDLSYTEIDQTCFAYTRFHKTNFTGTMPVRTDFSQAIGLVLPPHLQYLHE